MPDRSVNLPVCAECGAVYQVGHVEHDVDPCACFGAHGPRVAAYVAVDALLSESSVETIKANMAVVSRHDARRALTALAAALSEEREPDAD